MLDWLFINRNMTHNRLVIPGWSILPEYFNTILPKSNLVILSPFIAKDKLKTYAQQYLDYPTEIRHETVNQVLNRNIHQLSILSMGLQWVQTHAPQLFQLNCDIISPCISYNKSDITQLKFALKKSKKAALHTFYKQCFVSTNEWQLWKAKHHKNHIHYNCQDQLIHWLNEFGNKSATIPNTANIWLNPTDTIGIKPNISNMCASQINTHSNGHLFMKPLAL